MQQFRAPPPNNTLERPEWNVDRLEVFFKPPEQKRGTDMLLCFPSEHTEYPFTVRMGSKRWEVRKRYRDFFSFDSHLRQIVGDSHLSLPDLPGKVWMGANSPILIQERKAKLEQYLQSLVGIPEISKSGPVRAFLEFSEDGMGQGSSSTKPLQKFLALCRSCNTPLAAGRETKEGICEFCFKAQMLYARPADRDSLHA